MRLFKALLPVILGIFLLPVLGAPVYADRPVVVVIKSRDIPPYVQALEGLNRALKHHDVNAVMTVVDLKGSHEEGLRIAEEIRSMRPAVIVTIGSLATELARDQFKATPVVFCMVLNPVAGGLVAAMDSSGNNLTGAVLDIGPRQQFEMLRNILPSVRRIGVVYNPQETAVLITAATEAANDLGLELIARPIKSESDVPRALDELTIKGIDCLWSVSDSMVFNSFKSIQFIILHTLRHKIAFMGLSNAFVKSGALLAISPDVEDNGYQAGEQVFRILSGRSPSDLPIITPRKTYLSLNKKIAEQIGKRLSADVVALAKEVFN